MSAEIWDGTGEPKWQDISWAYESLAKASRRLASDVDRYKKALQELELAGNSINLGREEIADIKLQLAALEAAK